MTTAGFDPNAGGVSGYITSSTPAPMVGPVAVGKERPTTSASFGQVTENDLIREYGRMSDQRRKEIASKLKAAGYRVSVTGSYNQEVRDAFVKANIALSDEINLLAKGDPARLAQVSYNLDSYLDNVAAQRSAASGKAKGPTTQKVTNVLSPTEATAQINKVFQDTLGRDATAAEMKKFKAELTKAEKANPSVTRYTTVGGVTTSDTTGGLDRDQFIINLISKDTKLASEIGKLQTTDPNVLRRERDKATYDKALAAAGSDAKKIAAVEATTTYGRDLADLRNKINSYAVKVGAFLDAAELDSIAKEALDSSIEKDADTLFSFIDNKLKFTSAEGKYKGVAGQNVDELSRIAMANGLDLQKAFGSQLPEWLANINKGESIDTYKRIIRDVAKIGMPEKVVKLMDQGIDLQTIYAPYRNIMASTLEINPASIDMNDPTLRSAITAENEIPIYDFERALRKDNRWQYTNQAREEVSNATRQILQDFGFMG